MRDIITQIREYAEARSICGKNDKGDQLLQLVSSELLRERDLLTRLSEGPGMLSQNERDELGITLKEGGE